MRYIIKDLSLLTCETVGTCVNEEKKHEIRMKLTTSTANGKMLIASMKGSCSQDSFNATNTQ